MAAEMAERIGARMKTRREELRLTQAEVARRMPGTTTSDQVSRWERGKHHPQNLDPIAAALEVDVSYFYVAEPAKTETPNPFPETTIEERLERMERRLSGLIEQQNDLLRRQSEILEKIEAAMDEETVQGRVDAAIAQVVRERGGTALEGEPQLPAPARTRSARSGSRQAST